MKLTNNGFTIIELMIATAVFSVILIITTTTIIGVSQTYIKSSVQNQTQQTARSILSDISDNLQFNEPTPTLPTLSTTAGSRDVYYFCIGGDAYVYQLDKHLSSSSVGTEFSNWGLVRYPGCPQVSSVPFCTSGCGALNFPTGYTELLSTNERIGQLNLTQVSINGKIAYTINIELAYGANDLLNDTNAKGGVIFPDGSNHLLSTYLNGQASAPAGSKYIYSCQTGLDSSYCAVSLLTTTVAPRINN